MVKFSGPLKLSLISLVAGLVLFAPKSPPQSWILVSEIDENQGAPYLQCDIEEFGPTGMSENDYWYRIEEGTLAPGATWEVTNPRPACDSTWPVRLAWRFLGNGKAPTGITLAIIDPVNGAQFRADHETVVETRGGTPLWVRHCTNVSGADAYGTWIFRVTNNGSKSAYLRVAASIAHYETPIQQCPNWFQALSNYGI